MLSDKGTGSSKYINGRKEKDMTNLQELNKQFDALGMTNIRAAVITRGENKGKFAIIQIVPNGQPKEMYMSNKLESCEDYIRGKLKLPSKIRQEDIKSTRMVNSWIKQNGLGNMIKVASEQKGNKRVYTIYSLDPRVKNKEIYKGSLNQCVDFIKKQTGIKDDVKFTDLKSSMRRVGDKSNMFTSNTQVKQPVQKQNNIQTKNMSKIQNINDANDWVFRIGASNIYTFIIDPRSKERGGTIYTVKNARDYAGGSDSWSRSLYLMVQMVAKEMKTSMPPCIDDRGEKVVDVASANRWLQRTGYGTRYKFGTARKGGAIKYAYASIENGNLKIDGILDSLDEAIRLHCDNEGEPAPYMAWMDR